MQVIHLLITICFNSGVHFTCQSCSKLKSKTRKCKRTQVRIILLIQGTDLRQDQKESEITIEKLTTVSLILSSKTESILKRLTKP